MGPCEGAEMSQAAGTSFSSSAQWSEAVLQPLLCGGRHHRGRQEDFLSSLGEGFPGAQGPRQRSATAKRRQSGVMRDGRMRGSLTRPSWFSTVRRIGDARGNSSLFAQ